MVRRLYARRGRPSPGGWPPKIEVWCIFPDSAKRLLPPLLGASSFSPKHLRHLTCQPILIIPPRDRIPLSSSNSTASGISRYFRRFCPPLSRRVDTVQTDEVTLRDFISLSLHFVRLAMGGKSPTHTAPSASACRAAALRLSADPDPTSAAGSDETGPSQPCLARHLQFRRNGRVTAASVLKPSMMITIRQRA